MKWIKRLLLMVVFLAVFSGVIGIAALHMARRPPEWYTRRHVKPEEVAAAAQRAERQVQRTVSWAQDHQAYIASSRVGQPSTLPAPTLQISLSEDELNGFFQKWDGWYHWSDHYNDYISDPQIVVQEDRLILAATVKTMGTVMSVEFEPKLDEGKLSMPIQRVMAGRLPLPQTFWNGYRTLWETKMEKFLPAWQERAEILQTGIANPDAVKAAMAELLINVMDNRPACPILFLPYDLSNARHSLAVKLTGVEIAHKTLLLTVQPLDPQERQSVLDSIRAGTPIQTAAGAPGKTVAQ